MRTVAEIQRDLDEARRELKRWSGANWVPSQENIAIQRCERFYDELQKAKALPTPSSASGE